jgi:manganese/zinc/iron transport system permease protein
MKSAATTSRRATGNIVELAIYWLACIGVAVALLARTLPAEGWSLADLAAPLWTMLVGSVCSASCAILGCYLVLRRMSLLGDAISHAVLPGIALGYLFSGSVSGLPILIGATVLGVLTSVLTQSISNLGRVSEDTSLGVVFTSLFALGVIMIQAFARNVDLDADCVLYGLIDFAGVDLVPLLGYDISRPLLVLVPAMLLVLALVAVFWKELKIVAFDPALAAAMGFQVAAIHYLLMAMVAGVTVASFESVGSILVVAMLIVPAATAALLTERLSWMMLWAVSIAVTCAIYGYLVAVALRTSVAGAMAVVAGVQFTLAVFFAPRSGLFSRWLRNQSLAVRIAAEDILARLYRNEENAGTPMSAATTLPGNSGFRQTMVRILARGRLSRFGWIDFRPTAGPLLTSSGRTAARNLVRAHRLWESYLDTHFDLPRDHLHEAAERMEHFLGTDLADELAAELADRAVDPHGKTIPPKPSK